eukprot:2652909-Rhodomonas_salina.1
MPLTPTVTLENSLAVPLGPQFKPCATTHQHSTLTRPFPRFPANSGCPHPSAPGPGATSGSLAGLARPGP